MQTMKIFPALRRFPRVVRSESGQAFLETAVALPLLALLLLGAVEFARVAYAAIEVSNAASAGARYAVQSGYTASDATGIQNAASADAANLSSLTTTSSTSCVCSDGSASTCANTDCTNSHIEETVTVNTSTTFAPLIHLPGFPKTITLNGQAIQRCAQ